MPKSRKGRHKTDGSYAVQIGADVMAALQPVMAGRGGEEPLLCRWRYIQTGVLS